MSIKSELCHHCIEQNRTTCEGQEGWDELEGRFQSAYLRVKKMKEQNEGLKGVTEEFEKRKKSMVESRARNAKYYETIAERRGCRLLTILPFA